MLHNCSVISRKVSEMRMKVATVLSHPLRMLLIKETRKEREGGGKCRWRGAGELLRACADQPGWRALLLFGGSKNRLIRPLVLISKAATEMIIVQPVQSALFINYLQVQCIVGYMVFIWENFTHQLQEFYPVPVC